MTASDLGIDPSEYPAELVRYAADETARDADGVIALLVDAGLAPPPGEVRYFPPEVLLGLGAAVRLRRWEAGGHAVHVQGGLPTADAALAHLIRALESAATHRTPLADLDRLSRAVFDLAVTRFAWAARPDLGADIELAAADEDALVEAMAHLLWARRHIAPTA